jgi:hypothetical protein
VKTTIELDDGLYRRLKAEAALRGRTVKDLVAEAVQHVLAEPAVSPLAAPKPAAASPEPPWFGMLRGYSRNAAGRHDLASIRRSIARGRAAP